MSTLITLTTDFGTRDAYVAAMKGVMLQIAPSARYVDVSHHIAPQDVMEAAFVVKGAVPYFPPGTVHLVVVDPGVGTARRPVALSHDGQLYVGPDNGLFTLVLGDDEPSEVVELNRRKFWRNAAPSTTFHGRDIFAPVAAHLASGRRLGEVGSAIEKLAPMHWALPSVDEHGIQGWVVHVDHFGNCITNITRRIFDDIHDERALKCFAGSAILKHIQETYGSSAQGEPLLLFNSQDLLEISVSGGNAADMLSIRKGAPVNLVFASR